jgi:hypothetical protein
VLLQVGAVIANPKISKRDVLGEGYNRMPLGCEERFGWNKGLTDILKTKYPYGEFCVLIGIQSTRI